LGGSLAALVAQKLPQNRRFGHFLAAPAAPKQGKRAPF
jgi:hypothetical protein